MAKLRRETPKEHTDFFAPTPPDPDPQHRDKHELRVHAEKGKHLCAKEQQGHLDC